MAIHHSPVLLHSQPGRRLSPPLCALPRTLRGRALRNRGLWCSAGAVAGLLQGLMVFVLPLSTSLNRDGALGTVVAWGVPLYVRSW